MSVTTARRHRGRIARGATGGNASVDAGALAVWVWLRSRSHRRRLAGTCHLADARLPTVFTDALARRRAAEGAEGVCSGGRAPAHGDRGGNPSGVSNPPSSARLRVGRRRKRLGGLGPRCPGPRRARSSLGCANRSAGAWRHGCWPNASTASRSSAAAADAARRSSSSTMTCSSSSPALTRVSWAASRVWMIRSRT